MSVQWAVTATVIVLGFHCIGCWMDSRDGINALYRGADKSLARPGRKQATATEDFEFHISYL